MTYATLLQDVILADKKLKTLYENALAEDSLDEESGMHTVFNEVFIPAIMNALGENDRTELKRLFSFLDNMIECTDGLVYEVAAFTVLEVICDEYKDADILPFAGEETKKALIDIRRYIPENNVA